MIKQLVNTHGTTVSDPFNINTKGKNSVVSIGRVGLVAGQPVGHDLVAHVGQGHVPEGAGSTEQRKNM